MAISKQKGRKTIVSSLEIAFAVLSFYGRNEMKITAIEVQKKHPDRCSVFLDGEFAFGMGLEDALFYHLKEGAEIDEERLAFLKTELCYEDAKNTALHFLNHKMRTRKEMEKKLKESGFEEEIRERVLAFLEQYHFLDDLAYGKALVREMARQKKGRRALEEKFFLAGIDRETAQKAKKAEDLKETENALALLEKKLDGQTEITYRQKKKIQDFLLRRGFVYDTIELAFRETGVRLVREEESE